MRYELVLLAIYLVLTPILLTPTVHSNDGVGYYSYVRSWFVDGDVDLENEYDHYVEVFPEINRETSGLGRTTNRYLIGSAIFWSPFFLLGQAMAFTGNFFGGSFQTDGYAGLAVLFSMFSSSLYAFFGIIILYRLLKEFFEEKIAFITTLGMWFASPLIFYMWFLPSVSHAISFFITTAFIYYWVRSFSGEDSRTYQQWFVLGVLGALMTLVRHQNIFFLALPFVESSIIYWKSRVSFSNLKKLFLKNIFFLLVIILCAIPQMIVFNALTGSPFSVAQTAAADEHLGFLPIYVFNVLFSFHGLFSWTPLLMVGFFGLWFFYKKEKTFASYFVFVFLLQLYLLSSWDGWYGGAAFGQRKFLSTTFVFALGLASLIEQLRNARVRWWVIYVVILAFISWNFGLLIQFGSRMIPSESYVSIKTIIYNNFFEVPKRLLGILKDFLFNRGSFLR